jgi:hypothetical protein
MPTAVVEDTWGWDEETEECETQTTFQEAAAPAQVEANYWDWSEEQPSEETVDILSLSNIESNLIQAARNLNITSETNQQVSCCNDDYWAEQAEEGPLTKPQHEQASTGYWHWTAEQDFKKEMIKSILIEETARQQVSIEYTERSLIKASPLQEPVQVNANKVANDQYWSWVSPVHASHVEDKSHPVANYWDWDSEKTTSSQIAAIMEYERARKMLSVDYMVMTLLANPVKEQCCEPEPNAYWQWSDRLGDDYWDAPVQPAVTTDYWDM